jgi:hypothetical protein
MCCFSVGTDLEPAGRPFSRQTEESVIGDYCLHGLINYIDTKAKCRHLKN